eukprot:maker-scaffold_26-snap-gene-4.5-mRNA-1 protein AED:0.30 eAED:0.34 QI:0/0/0/1/0/0.33/3/0/563
MSVDLTKSASDLILEDSERRDSALFLIVQQNYDVSNAKFTEKPYVFKLTCKHYTRSLTWWSKKGYSGLMDHLGTHLDKKEIEKLKNKYNRKRKRKNRKILRSGSSKKYKVHTGSVLNFLLETNLPLSLLSSEEFKNIKNADDLVKEIKSELFCLIIDGWAHQGYSSNGVFLCFQKNKKRTFRLLGVLALEKETQTSNDIVPFMKNLMQKFVSMMIDLLQLLLMNKKVCRDLNTQFVGCINHRLALSVRTYIKSHADFDQTLDKVQLLFRKINNSKKLTAALRKNTPKAVILPNVTRWSGKFLMMKRYLDIWMFIAQIKDKEVKDLILGQRDTRILEKHLDFLATCDSYTVALQTSKFNLADGKKVVANLLRDVNNNDCLLKYLEDDANILAEFGAFETGVFKVYWEEEDKLDAVERTALSRLETDASEEEAKTPPGDSVVAELASQKRKSKKKSTFADLSFIPATSCSVERLFSQCKLIFNDKKNRMMPATLNRLAFLKMNQVELMDRNVHFAMKKNFPGFDDKEEEEMVEQMEEENEEEEREDLILEGVCSCDKEVHSDDEA